MQNKEKHRKAARKENQWKPKKGKEKQGKLITIENNF